MGPSLSIYFDPENTVLGGAIMDVGGGQSLLDFVDKVMSDSPCKLEYWTNGYTVQVYKEKDKLMVKICFRLSDEYEPAYIELSDLKRLLEIYINENVLFKKNPDLYIAGLGPGGVKEFEN